ncbi:hypothetical protein O1611_g5338 [Lasiodiplodia mahajangana]|uniref:Uncharacterized protein n=1 Tax=Lasiodiplodia mahajangana TaxID=1108764 RepID=A0ACC2JLQ4_9PEZI|nr:hypothetical protein O1611_g5338 [Lasiodiplodia mahajangana]
MPDDEMEMTVDFGQAGFVEDIDIDLDFPAGQPDEDMDLEDFDRVHDIHNFNSDTRDELMAEGDDASYAMIDAIETDHNVSAVATNDIDIELEHTVEGIWQQDPSHSAGFNLDTEIDYDETTAENMDAERNDVETSEWLPAVTNSEGTDAMDHAAGISGIFTAAQEPQQVLLTEDSIPSYEETSEPTKASNVDAETAYSLAASGLKETSQPSDLYDLPEDEIAEAVAQASDRSSAAEQDDHSIPPPIANTDIESENPNSNLQESNEQQEASHSDEVVQTGPGHANEALVSDGLEQPEHFDVTEPGNVKEDHVDPLLLEEADESADDSTEYQLGGESHIEPANDQTSADDAVPQVESPALSRSDLQPLETDPARDIESDEDEVATIPGMKTPITEVSNRDDPIELAEHYGIYISYGETDYRLFARSDDDDPNQYFLTDKSALEISLAQFLTSLREVISEEISPLDDLVLQVDGLGLEFSESTTPDFLGKYTFGDLVILYDKLVKNEQVESLPPIYTYLTVKPNCNRRMMALGESANAGRGLSEVALYHDSSSLDGEQVNDAGSPDTDFSTGDYDDGENGSIYGQEDFEEDDTFNDDRRQNSPPITAEAPVEHKDQNEETDELNNDDQEPSLDGSADADDHEQGVSTSKQGIYPFIFHYQFSCTQDSTCSCEDCYELELQHLATPIRAEVWPTPGIVVPTHNPTHMIWMTNRTTTEDDATSDSSALLLQEASDHEQHPSPKVSTVGESNLQTPKIATSNPLVDTTNSENTSVTATLDGEDHDEIGYDSDEDGGSVHDGIDGSDTQKQPSVTATESNVVVDDEITWESDDDEEDKHETKGGLATDTVQVSPVSGKRSRSDSDALDGADDKTDYKRRRS